MDKSDKDEEDDKAERVIAILDEAMRTPRDPNYRGPRMAHGCMSLRAINRALGMTATNDSTKNVMDQLIALGDVQMVGQFYQRKEALLD